MLFLFIADRYIFDGYLAHLLLNIVDVVEGMNHCTFNGSNICNTDNGLGGPAGERQTMDDVCADKSNATQLIPHA